MRIRLVQNACFGRHVSYCSTQVLGFQYLFIIFCKFSFLKIQKMLCYCFLCSFTLFCEHNFAILLLPFGAVPALSIRGLARCARSLCKHVLFQSRGFRHGQGTALHDTPSAAARRMACFPAVSLWNRSLLFCQPFRAFFITFTQLRSVRRNTQPEQTFKVCEAVGCLKNCASKHDSAVTAPVRSRTGRGSSGSAWACFIG